MINNIKSSFDDFKKNMKKEYGWQVGYKLKSL